ncbi:amidase [Rhodococcus sp. 27YEA15]|uniref:amidase family protein n=1 Tax=Rhodococcus sp. 27YEA15 TaxID=3156259 RepID=UPI003C7A964C
MRDRSNDDGRTAGGREKQDRGLMMGLVHCFTEEDSIGNSDATDLAYRIRAKEVSIEEVFADTVTRIEKVEPIIKAVQCADYVTPESSGDVSAPFHGIPTFVKDNTMLRGFPVRMGSKATRSDTATESDEYGSAFSGMGFTLLGKSKLPELAGQPTTEYEVGDPTVNPWNTGHSAGGSSGGAAALVASGAVTVAHANDGGGSIRMPAAWNGLVGMKWSPGRHITGIPRNPAVPDFVSQGVLSRSVRDQEKYMIAMDAQSPRGARSGPVSSGRYSGSKYRVGIISQAYFDIDAEVAAAVTDIGGRLASRGLPVAGTALPYGAEFIEAFYLFYGYATAGLVGLFGLDPAALEVFTREIMLNSTSKPDATEESLAKMRAFGKDVYSKYFSDFDVIITPVAPHAAPELGYLGPLPDFETSSERWRKSIVFGAQCNIAEAPAISVPVGLSTTGLPIGVQILGKPGDDAVVLDLAYLVEEAAEFSQLAYIGA